MSSWGICDNAPIKEKIKSKVNDTLMGMNSCGEIDICLYDKLYDLFLDALDKIVELGVSESDDLGFVIYDKKQKLYYCGLRKWDKQLRKAQIYHSEKYLSDKIKEFEKEINDCKEKGKLYNSPLKGVDSLVVRKVLLVISDTYNLDDGRLKCSIKNSDVSSKENKTIRSYESSSERKRILNKEFVKELSVGDKVRVKRTGEEGIIVGFVEYDKYSDDREYDYISIKVKFSDDLPPRKRNRRFSGSSLERIS